MTEDLKKALRQAHDALNAVVTLAVAHGRDAALIDLRAALDRRTPRTTAAPAPKRRKFRKSKAWREAVKKNLAKGRAKLAASKRK